jgi:hypothetical protein
MVFAIPLDISCGASGDVRLVRTANFASTVQHIDRGQPERANGETPGYRASARIDAA